MMKTNKPFNEKTENNEITPMFPVTPNDEHFNRQWALKNTGSSVQGSGAPDADIDADQAWNITTGSSSVKVGVIGQGIDRDHEDLSGKVSGDDWGRSGHETAIAGIIAAKGNNTDGIAGIAYNVQLVDAYTWNGSLTDISNAIIGASNNGAQIMNYSYGLNNGHSNTVRRAIRDVYKLDRVFITSMGNDNSSSKKYPAAYKDGVISVGATTNTDARASYSNKGNWIDVAAPGGVDQPGTGKAIYSTVYSGSAVNGGGYGDQYEENFSYYTIAKTSVAAPHVTGIAALLLSENSILYNDDIENIIEISAEDKYTSGFDNLYGHGRVNAYEALKLLQSPYVMNYGSTTGGSFYSQSGDFPMRTYDVSGLSSGLQYYVKRVEVRKNISFSYLDEPNVWCRGVESVGWTKEENHGGAKRNYGQGFCEVVPGTLTNTSAT
ncbi:MAG: S8 family serine peptidase, partial [Gracilimonas sp.]